MLYHRSNSAFIHFNQSYWKDGREGKGVYMSDKDNFKSYGKYLYIIEYNCGHNVSIYDFTDEKNILEILRKFLRQFDTRKIICKELNNECVQNYIEGVKEGIYSCTQLIKNIWDCVECELYEKNYRFDLLTYNEKLIKDWEIFLFDGILKYYDSQFEQDVYLTRNINNIRIISIVADTEN